MQGWYNFSISTCSGALETYLLLRLNHYAGRNIFCNLSQMTSRSALGSQISRTQPPILHSWSAPFISKFITVPMPTRKCMWFTSAFTNRETSFGQLIKPVLNSIISRIGTHWTPLKPHYMGLPFPISKFFQFLCSHYSFLNRSYIGFV